MRRIFLLALGLTVAYPAMAGEITLRKECSRDRCVYYKGSKRVFSVENEADTSRVIIRDAKRRPVAKVERERNGTIRIKKSGSQRKDLLSDLYEED
jgi:hypothetical protein